MPTQDQRSQQLSDWVKMKRPSATEPALISGDASFRRYFRLEDQCIPIIAVDAPPQTEKNQFFIDISNQLKQAGIAAPVVHAACLDQGFLLLSDLGQTHLADTLRFDTYTDQYRAALQLLLHFQQNFDIQSLDLPCFDQDFMAIENAILPQWLAEAHLGASFTDEEQSVWQQAMEWLAQQIQSQPYGPMHRDYHSRNLMWQGGRLAMIDFQDMVIGPVTYDLVSLLRDCYQSWPDEQMRELALDYGRQRMGSDFDPDLWLRWFDLTGLQRHLKAAGIFARLYHRDNKPGYLPWIEPTLAYVQRVVRIYPELNDLAELVDSRLVRPLRCKNNGEQG